MTTIVWGHGSRSKGEEKTFVPDGTTVKWYSTVDENLLTNNGFLAIESGEFGTPSDEQGPGKDTSVEIFNYELFEDLGKRDWVSLLHKGDEDLLFVGAEVKQGFLCNAVAACRTAGEHTCDGLLGRVEDDEIVILVCRGIPGGNRATAQYGGDADSPLSDTSGDLLQFVTEFIGRVYADPDAAMAEYEELSDPMKLHLAPWPGIQAFHAVHWAAYYASSGDPDGAFRQLGEQAGNDQVPTLIGAVDVYRGRLAAGARAAPDQFFALLDAAPDPIRAAVGGIGRVQQAREDWEFQGEQQRQGQAMTDWQDEAANTWVPSESDLGGVAAINKSTVKEAGDGDTLSYEVAGFVMLVGDQHGGEWYTWARGQADYASGTITVEKGGILSQGSFEVTGCPMTKQGVVEAAIAAFSEKEVSFA